MRIALPLDAAGRLAAHFGASVRVAIAAVDLDRRVILELATADAAPIEPCAGAERLRARGVDVLFAGAIGDHAARELARQGIEVIAGVTPGAPADVVHDFLRRGLVLGANPCAGPTCAHGGPHAPDGDHGSRSAP